MGRRLLHWGPITALLIIGSLFLVALLAIVIWWFPNTLSGVIHALVFHFWVANILKHFFKSAFMGPGLVPFKWMPKEAGHLQYCQQCEGYKPPRAHHCKSCKRCVMKMDHHCPWVNNCVGHRNHRSFTLFLVYVVVGCSHCAIILICCIVQHLVWKRGYVMIKYDPYALIPVRQSIMLIMCFGVGLSAGVSIAVAFLLYHQIKSILTNATGIESWIIEKATRRERDDEFVYPYDLGMYNNFKQVMSWSHDYIGDGITWSVFEGCSQYELTIEQLIQKEMKRENTLDCVACNDYNGAWFPIFAHGARVCWDSPWSEERRVPLKKGDVFYVTRWRKHWAYGERLNHDKDEAPSLGDERRVKGWVPRSCLVDEYTKKSE